MTKAEIIKKPIENMGSSLKQSAFMGVIESLATVVLGVCLIAWPDMAIKIISYVAGIFFVVKGAYQVINYFMVKGQRDYFNNDLLAGIISVLIGITVLVMGEEIAQVFRIVIGIWMIYEALVRMNTAIKMHAAGLVVWKYILILALLMLVLGVFVTFYNGAVVTLIGWLMVITGAIGIVGDVMFMQYVNILIGKLTGREDK